jgi:hypothetical protein
LPKSMKVEKERLEKILDKYEGNSDGNIMDYVMNCIDEV